MSLFTIDPTTAGFSREVALYLANACDLAYSDDPKEAAHEMLGLEAEVFRHPASDTQGFVGRAERFAVLAFRGSEQVLQHPKDWLVDFQFQQTRNPHFTGGVHSGFSTALSSARDTLGAILRRALTAAQEVGADDPGLPLFVTGHSLGGALATLATCRLAAGEFPTADGARPVRVNHRATYTFGAPRVGDLAFCQAYTSFTCRVVNDLDWVPQVPLQGKEVRDLAGLLPKCTPEWIRILVERAVRAPLYGHVDTLFHLDDDGRVSQQAAGLTWLGDYYRRSIQSLGRSLNAPFDDHAIDSYIRALSR
jgi:triacylglycerol lipase